MTSRGFLFLEQVMKRLLYGFSRWLIPGVVLLSTPVGAQIDNEAAVRGARIKAIAQSLGEESTSGLRYHALVIGINAYDESKGWLPLAFPESDAKRVAKLLEESYDFDQVNYLSGRQATKAGITEAIAQYKSLTKDDALFVFYAGHGFLVAQGDERDGYWIPVDGEGPDGGAASIQTWVAMSSLRELLQESSARHILLVSDSCYAGAFFPRGFEAGSAEDRVRGTLYDRQIREPSRFVLTSGNLEEVPDRSFFTESLIRLLERDRAPHVFSAEDLYYRLKDEVYDQTGTQVLGREIMETSVGGNFVFIQRAPVIKDTMVVLQITPPEAQVSIVKGVANDHVSERVLDDQERKVGEHRIRTVPDQEIHLAVTAPGFHDEVYRFKGRPQQKRLDVLRMRRWVPRKFVSVDEPLSGKYNKRSIDDGLVKKASQDEGTWRKGEVTMTRVSPSERYFSVGVYVRETNLRASRRHNRTYAGIVMVRDTVAGTQRDLACYKSEPKQKGRGVHSESAGMSCSCLVTSSTWWRLLETTCFYGMPSDL